MSTLSNRCDGRKPVGVENPATAFQVNLGRFVPILPIGLIPKPLPARGDPDRLRQMLLEGAPPSAMKVYLVLDELARYRTDGHGMHRAAWPKVWEICRVTGLSSPTVRVTALPWLREHGWISEQVILYKGKPRVMWWCHWLLPFDPAGQVPDFGQDRLPSSESRPKPPRKSKASHPQSLPPGPGSAEILARQTAPDSSYELERETEETTDRVNAENVVVDSAPPPGEEDGGTQADLPGEPLPAAAIDPAIAAVLEAEFPDAGDRDELAAEVAGWLTRCVVEWVVKLIKETAAARRKRAATPKPVHSLAGFAGGTLANWLRAGQPTLRAARSAASGGAPAAPPVNAPSADVVEANRARAIASRAPDPRQLWDAADPGERAVVEAEWDLANPARPPQIQERYWPGYRKLGCIELFAQRRQSHATPA
jgi:hypothetical protein